MLRPWITGSRRFEGTCRVLLAEWWRGKLVGKSWSSAHTPPSVFYPLQKCPKWLLMNYSLSKCKRMSKFEMIYLWVALLLNTMLYLFIHLFTHSLTFSTVRYLILIQISKYEAFECESNANLISCFWVTNHRLIPRQADIFGRPRQWPHYTLTE